MYKIGFRIDGQTVVLSSDDTVRHAMVRGDLRRDTRVLVEQDEREVFVGPAGEFDWLDNLFSEVFPEPVAEEPAVSEDEPAAPAVTSVPTSEPDPETVGRVDPPAVPRPDPAPAPERVVVPSVDEAPLHTASAAGKTGDKPGQGPWAIMIAGFVALIVFVFWFAGRESDYSSYDPLPLEEAPPAEAAAPAYPVLDTGRMHSYPETLAGSQIFQVGDLLVELSSLYNGEIAVPMLKLTDPEGQTVSLTGEGRYAHAEFGVGDLDGSGRPDDLIFTSFSGGAHCCYEIRVLTKHNGQWRNVDFGVWDGSGLSEFPVDLGGDAAPEFRAYDNSFLYAFDSYAASASPLQILKLRGGQKVDVSTDRAYRQLHVNRMAELEPACRRGENGACAAYVASAARVGNMSPAWAIMLDSYVDTEWELPTACLIPTEEACPASLEVAYETFPEALQYFLGERGYASKSYVSARQWDGKPSFDCDGISDGVTGLICNSPYLRLLDHQLAVAYTRAMAFSKDRIGLQRTQQAWIAQRDSQPLDSDSISKLYQSRITELTGG